ncbi:hypothetical protein C9E85_14735 [Plesiomonas shigelloides]|uniref:hypothetical protein n=1 Tax=Plesiomonas shigelloides TaxID=703 RepID=UPI000D56CC00|nr:hypothetical protein [Plesiomonas shigelloides]PVU65087.1 hypothetical protein C9E85_14735 [Plesiomonas shigelloides]
MSTTSANAVYGQYQNLEKHLYYIRKSVSALISKTNTVNNPLGQISVGMIKNDKGDYVVLTPYSSGGKHNAHADMEYDVEYHANKQFFFMGNVYTVLKDKTTIIDDSDFIVKLYNGDIILHTAPIDDIQSADFELSQVDYKETVFRSDLTKSRAIGAKFSYEFIEDLQNKYKDPALFDQTLGAMIFDPVMSSIDNQVVSTCLRLATPYNTVLNVASGSFIAARDLMAKIKYKSGLHFSQFNTGTSAMVVSSPVLALMLGSGLVEQQLSSDGAPVEARYITADGITIAAYDPFAGVRFDYALCCSVDQLEDTINNASLHTCFYQPSPDQPIFNMLEYRDPKNFQPSFRTACRYNLIAPSFEKDTPVINPDCGSEDWINKQAGKSHVYFKMRIHINDLTV